MEFRQVVHSVCRSAAAASRPSLLVPSGILLQHHQFSTNSKQQKPEVAAAVQPESQPLPPIRSPVRRARVNNLHASISQDSSHLPPRPAPIRRGNFFMDKEANKQQNNNWPAPRTSTAAQSQTPETAQQPARAATLTGTAPASSSTFTWSSASGDDPFSLVDQIRSDARRATGGGLAQFDESKFVNLHYGPQLGEPRLRPSTGRTIEVKGNVDVARGLRLLQRAVAQNGIKRDLFLQRAHERPALKRKRQKRERWQARFKGGFKATIARVMELKAQGW